MKYLDSLIRRAVPKISLSLVVAGTLFSCQSAGDAKAGSGKAANDAAKPKAPVSAEVASTGAVANEEQRKLVVYYLHTTFRCPSCNKIERLTKEAVEGGFADQIKSGRVEMRVLNVEEPGNEHFVEDYKLYTKSVILSDLTDGKETKWKNLDQVWALLGNEGKFVKYIQEEVSTYLKG